MLPPRRSEAKFSILVLSSLHNCVHQTRQWRPLLRHPILGSITWRDDAELGSKIVILLGLAATGDLRSSLIVIAIACQDKPVRVSSNCTDGPEQYRIRIGLLCRPCSAHWPTIHHHINTRRPFDRTSVVPLVQIGPAASPKILTAII